MLALRECPSLLPDQDAVVAEKRRQARPEGADAAADKRRWLEEKAKRQQEELARTGLDEEKVGMVPKCPLSKDICILSCLSMQPADLDLVTLARRACLCDIMASCRGCVHAAQTFWLGIYKRQGARASCDECAAFRDLALCTVWCQHGTDWWDAWRTAQAYMLMGRVHSSAQAYMLQSAELAEAVFEKKRKRPAPPGPKTYDPDAMLRAYERRSEAVPMTPEEYAQLKATVPEFYRTGDSMLHGVRAIGTAVPNQAVCVASAASLIVQWCVSCRMRRMHALPPSEKEF